MTGCNQITDGCNHRATLSCYDCLNQKKEEIMHIDEPLMMVMSVLYIAVFVVFANRFNQSSDAKDHTDCANDWMK